MNPIRLIAGPVNMVGIVRYQVFFGIGIFAVNRSNGFTASGSCIQS